MKSTLVILVALVLLAVGAGTGRAQPQGAAPNDPLAEPSNPEARARFLRGNSLFREHGDYRGALEEFKAGVLIEAVPSFHFNLGLCYKKLGEFRDAIFHFRRFLDLGKVTGDNRTIVEGLIAKMEAELNHSTRDAEPNDPAPDVHLSRKPAGQATTAVAPETQEHPSAGALTAVPWYEDRLGWLLAGTGVAVAAIGGLSFSRASGLMSDAQAEPRQAESRALASDAANWKTIGATSLVVGSALIVAGIVKLVITPRVGVEMNLSPTAGGGATGSVTVHF